MKISKEFLVKGAMYALEQCGLLLKDSVALQNQKSYSSALVLAAYAREELGRCRILINLFNDMVNNGKDITIKDIEKDCEDHVTKQRWANLSTQFSAPNDSYLGKLLQKRMQTHVQSEEFRKLSAEIDALTEKIRKRAPTERHLSRLKSLYVMPNEYGTDWNIPKNISKEVTFDFIMHAVNDYSAQRQILKAATTRKKDEEFTKELLKWTGRPPTTQPEWPNNA